MSDDPRIITPGQHEGMTPKQAAAALLPEELPPCVGNEGNDCPHPVQPVLIAGYDDKYRCPACNRVHIALVEEEAGASTPNATQPKFVSRKLDVKAKLQDRKRAASVSKMFDKFEAKGHRGRPTNAVNLQPIEEGEYRDMKEAMAADEHGTRDEGISPEERKRRILAKYSKRTGGNKLVR